MPNGGTGGGGGNGAITLIPFLRKVDQYVLNPLIILLFSVALVVFLFGVFKFVMGADNPTARGEGQKSILWGVVGMFVMFGVYFIIKIVLGTFGISGPAGGFPF